MNNVTFSLFQGKGNMRVTLMSLFFILLLNSQGIWGQQPISTGQFDGGFEGATFYTAGALSQTTADATKWSYDSSGLSTSNISTTDKRSGDKSFYLVSINVGTGKYIMSPKCNPVLLGGDGTNNGPAYVVQYFIKSASSVPTKGAINISNRFSGTGTQGTADSNGWQKVTYRYANASSIAQTTGTWVGVGTNLTSSGSSWTAYIDDVVVYVGSTDDNTAPDSPIAPVVSGLDVSWTAPVSGVDGGGYVVVRYSSNPNNDNDPNVNGIYAVGNTITNGTGSLIGKVVYIGTSTSFTDNITGSVIGSDFYKIYTVDKAFNYSNEITGSVVTSTIWNGTAWSNGTPTSSLDAIIAGDYSTTANGVFTAKTLTVNASKSFTINSGNTITVAGAITDNGNLVVQNNANLIQTNSTPVTNTGSIVVNRNSSNIQLYDYTLWSSPVAGQKLKAFSPDTLDARFYSYNSGTNLYNVVSAPATTDFASATGYLIRTPNTWAATTPTTFNGVFTGVPNNGDIPFTMSVGAPGFRYNLVGNPYPSPISITSFVSDNSTITGTLYFWRKTNGTGTAYCTYAGSTFTTNGNAQAADPNGIIQTGQGFFVEANGSGTALLFKNSQRVSNTAGQFFRSNNVIENNRIWLNATNSAGAFSQMAVGYMTDATQNVDSLDGKYINDSQFALTSLINSEEYTIQGRALPFSTSDSIPLGFKTDAAGNYTIAIDHVDGLFSNGQAIYLKDNLLNTVTNLGVGSYSFATAAGTFNSRFELVFQRVLGISNPEFTSNNIVAFNDHGDISINSGSTVMEQVRVYDLQGRLLVEKKQINATETRVNTTAVNQVLLLEITATTGSKVIKKIIQ